MAFQARQIFLNLSLPYIFHKLFKSRNQELIEKLKNEICGFKKDEVEHRLAAEQTRKDIKIITEKLIEMIFKLQEVDECDVNLPDRVIPAVNLANYLENDATDEDLLNVSISIY